MFGVYALLDLRIAKFTRLQPNFHKIDGYYKVNRI